MASHTCCMHGVKCAKKVVPAAVVSAGFIRLLLIRSSPVTLSGSVCLFSSLTAQSKKTRQTFAFRSDLGDAWAAKYFTFVFRTLQHLRILCENWSSLGGGLIFASVPSPPLFPEPQWPHFLPIIVFFNTPPTPVRGPPLIKRPFPAAQPQRQEARGVFPCIIYERKKAPGRQSEANSKQFFFCMPFFLAPQLSVGT